MYEMENPGYDLDNHRVATFLKKYVQGNTIAESRIQSVPGNATDGRAIWLSLKVIMAAAGPPGLPPVFHICGGKNSNNR